MTIPYEQVRRRLAEGPLVLAMDVGSTGTRGCLYDAHGRPVGKSIKVEHGFVTGDDGRSEIDADQVVGEIAQIIDGLTGHRTDEQIAGVALDTFASSLIGVDGDGAAITACYTYADARCALQVGELRDQLDEPTVQQRTGTRLHTSYQAPRIKWLRRHQPDLVDRVATWMSLGEYIQFKLAGARAVSTPAAAWSGLLNRHTLSWDAELLAACGESADRLQSIQHPGVPLVTDPELVARRWPGLRAAQWFPAVPDGLVSNIGTGATGVGTIGLTTATSGAMRVLTDSPVDKLPSGLWCYRVDDRLSLLGGAINDVGRAFDWAREVFRVPDDTAALDEILGAEPVLRTPAVVPFLTGERAPGWAAGATAVFGGVTVAASAQTLYRAVGEGVAVTYARVLEQLREAAPEAKRIIASGGVVGAMPHLLQIMADTLANPVEHAELKRATLRGTALLALDTVAPDVERASSPIIRTFRPRSAHATYYGALRRSFDRLYPTATG